MNFRVSSSPKSTTRSYSMPSTKWLPAAGLSIGLPLANARAICPEITVHDADEPADRKTLEDIADWSDRFTPLVALDLPHGLFLDITGGAHLFGGEAALLRMVCGALTPGFYRQRGDRWHLDLRANADAQHPGTIVADGGEAGAVSRLPVFSLGLTMPSQAACAGRG